MKTKLIFSLFFISILIFACSNSNKKPLNPNGDSELALLMRAMHENGMEMKAQLEKGEIPKVNVDYSKIKTAKETPGMKPANVPYDTFADIYIHSMKKLEKCTNVEEAKVHFQNMQTNCLNCHQQMCPGPIVKINKLTLGK